MGNLSASTGRRCIVIPTDEDVRRLLELLERSELEFVIQYGSSLNRSEFEDIDILIVGGTGRPVEAIHLGRLDILRLSVPEASRLTDVLDGPHIVEPVLTGTALRGGAAFERARAAIRSAAPTEAAVHHAYQWRDVERAYAVSDGVPDGEARLSLRMALAQHLYALRYSDGGGPVALAALLPQFGATDTFSLLKQNPRELTVEVLAAEVDAFFQRAKSTVTRGDNN